MAKKLSKICIDCNNEFTDCGCGGVTKIRCEECQKKLVLSLLSVEDQKYIKRTEEETAIAIINEQIINDKELELIKEQRKQLTLSKKKK